MTPARDLDCQTIVWTNLIQIRMQASSTKAAKLSMSLSYWVATRREFLARLKKRSIRLRRA